MPYSAILSPPAREQRTERKSSRMRKLILIALAATCTLTLCAAKEYEWPQLPEGTLPDSEVSTNVTLHVNMSRLDEFSLCIEASNCVSNEVLVAIGHDADEDGDLSFDETAFVFGIDCGSRYLADYAAGRVLDDVDETLRISHRDFDPSWNLAKVVKRGEGEVDAVGRSAFSVTGMVCGTPQEEFALNQAPVRWQYWKQQNITRKVPECTLTKLKFAALTRQSFLP